MKGVAAVFGIVVGLDAVVVLWWVTPAGGVALLIIYSAAAAGVLIRRWSMCLHAPRGWSLGRGVELSDPDRPQRVRDAMVSDAVLKLGVLAVGNPGAGKTESVALGLLDSFASARPEGGWAYFEGKGDTDIYKKAVAMGARIDHFFSTEWPGSDSVNLMEGAGADVVDRLTRMLIGKSTATDYYADLQRAMLHRVVPVLCALPVPVCLRDLYVVLTDDGAAHETLRLAREAGVDATAVALWTQTLARPREQRVSELAGLLNRLFLFVNGPLAPRLNAYAPTLCVAHAVAAGRTVYFHLPLTEVARDVAVALVEMFGVQARHRQLSETDAPLYPLVFDDWGRFFHDHFGPFSARCRSANMPLMFCFQSRAQLDAVSPTFAQELDDNTATKVILRVTGEATVQYALRLLGESERAAVAVSDYGAGGATQLAMQREPRLVAQQLRELAPGEAYVSTLLETERGRWRNPLWRLQLPLPPMSAWRDVRLPAQTPADPGVGLGLWSRYVDPETVKALNDTLLAQARAHEVRA